MGETIRDMEKPFELQNNKTNFLLDFVGTSDGKTIKQMEKVNSTRILDKTDGIKKIR